MASIQAFVGLDVHKDKVVVAVALADGGEPRLVGTIRPDPKQLLKVLDRIAPRAEIRCCYEAGPTGFGLQRELTEEEVECWVIAPSLIPKKSGKRVKTDRIDARALAAHLRADLLTRILVPDVETEAMRDLERARRDASRALLVAKQQLGAFLLRHGRRHPFKSSWTNEHFDWLNAQSFELPAHEAVFTDALHAVVAGKERVAALDRQLERLAKTWPRFPLVRALQALRGVSLLTAVTLVAEIVDFRRFATPRKLMGYVGVVPSEDSSGDRVARGSITRAGNSAVRRVITEAAWNHRFKPRISRPLRVRSQGLAPGVKAIAWKAQQRLHRRLFALLLRGKNKNKASLAVGRELLGFIWAIAHEKQWLEEPKPVACSTK